MTVGPNSKFINEETKNNSKNNYHFEENTPAIKFINDLKTTNDTILVKASHGMNFIEIVENINN